MNIWYIIAAALGGLAALLAYYGATVDSNQTSRKQEEQTERIESKLQELGNQLYTLKEREIPISSEELDQIEKEYLNTADTFFNSLPLKVAEHKTRDATRIFEEVKMSKSIESHVKRLEEEIRKLGIAFNSAAKRTLIEVSSTSFPDNLFELKKSDQYHILISFEGKSYWALRFVTYPDRKKALEFIRLTTPSENTEYSKMFITEDSIQMVFLGEQFGVSLNQSLSTTVRDIVADIPKTPQPMTDFDQTAVKITKRLIEHQLLMNKIGKDG
ncbi:hypothetical protein [Nitrospira sp. M1]